MHAVTTPRRKTRIGFVLLAVMLAAAALSQAAGAATGSIGGTLRGLPGSADYGAVEAIDPSGQIEGVDLASPSGSFELKLPPGDYVLAGSGTTESDSFSSFSPPKQVGKGKKVSLAPKLGSTAARAAAAGEGLVPKGSIMAMEGVLFSVGDGPTLNLGSLVLNDLFRACSKRGLTFVDVSPEFVRFAQQEKALSASGKLATPFEYRPLKPQYLILGVGKVTTPEGHGEPFKYDFELNLATSAHLGVNAAATEVQSSSSSYDFDAFRQLVTEASTQFATKVCG